MVMTMIDLASLIDRGHHIGICLLNISPFSKSDSPGLHAFVNGD